MRLIIERAVSPSVFVAKWQSSDSEEYPSADGTLLMRLEKDSEIRFGPAYYSAAVYSADGKYFFDFEDRRFFSCSGYGRDSSKGTDPWSPASNLLALPELLSKYPGPGIKIARIAFFDVSRRADVAAWDFESLVTHKMWSLDGQFYLFRDVFGIFVFSINERKLSMISESKTQHCFFLDRSVCVIEKTGKVSILDGASGSLLLAGDIPDDRGTVRRATFDRKQNSVWVLTKLQDEPDAAESFYCVRLLSAD
jgi:hypothetical protein